MKTNKLQVVMIGFEIILKPNHLFFSMNLKFVFEMQWQQQQ